MKAADRDLRLDIYAEARQQLGSAWTPELAKRSNTQLEQRTFVRGARVKVGTEGFSLLAATSTRPLSGGWVPAWNWHADEFGARNKRATIDTHSPKGTPYKVTKTINRQLPGRVSDGRIAFDAASVIGTRLVGVWVNVIVEKYVDAATAEVTNG